MTGEIIDGEIIVTPRPSRKHGFCATALGTAVTAPYQFGQGGGLGGWIFIIELEIRFGDRKLTAASLLSDSPKKELAGLACVQTSPCCKNTD
jgi:hypothetical protein